MFSCGGNHPWKTQTSKFNIWQSCSQDFVATAVISGRTSSKVALGSSSSDVTCDVRCSNVSIHTKTVMTVSMFRVIGFTGFLNRVTRSNYRHPVPTHPPPQDKDGRSRVYIPRLVVHQLALSRVVFAPVFFNLNLDLDHSQAYRSPPRVQSRLQHSRIYHFVVRVITVRHIGVLDNSTDSST
jgi:hypothetical protein